LAEFSNPNLQGQSGGSGGGGGDMRGMMAFTLLFLVVLLGYQYFFKPQQPPPQTPPPPPAAQSQSQPPSQPKPTLPAADAAVQPQLASAPVAAVSPSVAATIETTTTVENENYKIVFTNQGAQVKSWVLKKYFDTAGKPLDMVQPQASAYFGLPLSLFTYEPALNEELNKKALYQLTATGAQPTVTGHVEVPATSALTFHYAANGLDVVKTFRFDASYVLTVEAAVKRNGAPVRALIQWPAGLGDMEEFLPSSSTRSSVPTSAASQFDWSLNGKQDSEAVAKIGNNATLDLPYSYAAVTDLYFVAAFLPETPDRATLVTLHNTIDLPSVLSDPKSEKKPAHVLGLAMGDTSGSTRLRLYAGPKAMDLLTSIHATGADGKPTGQSLEPLIQYGWLTVIAKPLYLALRFLVEHGVNNWGWAIIIVTIIFNLVLLPTRVLMMKSSLKMMRIQPKVEALKQRYAHLKATDPKRAEMNAEMMDLYKTEGVNMYGSCLPMLIQMPLFFAYFRLLQNTVELRQAHWYWLSDLSSPDPLHILPILIIITMFLTQYITPSPGMDATQRRMLAIMMPAMFGFMLWTYASGLSLYWGTGNILNMAIQISINQSHIGKEMSAIAAKRAAKKTGVNPKTIQGKR
jgi:YidC/Oxa1 family membrane protein insertase